MTAPRKMVVVRSVPVGNVAPSNRYVVISRHTTDAGTVTWCVRHVRPTDRHDEWWTTYHRTKRAAWAAADATIALWARR